MPKHLRPPRGYRLDEYPLPHQFAYVVNLQAEDETKNSTYFPILRTSEVLVTPEAIVVNPANAAFAEDPGCLIHKGSIVPKIRMTLNAYITKVGRVTDAIKAINFEWTPIYIAFLNSLEAEDTRTAIQVEDILELSHDTTNKDTIVNFSTVKIYGSAHPLSTVGIAEALADVGLTTTAIMESVALDKSLIVDAKHYFDNGGMLKKVMGKTHRITIKDDRPYNYFSNNFTYPSVKRGNPYTFCGILLHVAQAGDAEQLLEASETTAIDHITVKARFQYNEWNPVFDQAQM